MILPIITIPNRILRQKSRQVLNEVKDQKILKFIKDLEETLRKKKNPQGVGLSAPQVNKSWRIFSTFLPIGSVDDREDLKDRDFVITTYINPEIIAASKKLILGNEKPNAKSQMPNADREPILEGCLSIPKIYGPVYRHQWVKLSYLSLTHLGGAEATNFRSLLRPGGPERKRGTSIASLSKKTATQVIPLVGKEISVATVTATFTGFTARVIQHELDHLDGILFTDRSLRQGLPLYEEQRGKLVEISL